MTLNLKNRLLIMHSVPGEIRKYITLRHGLSQIVVLHEDSKTDNCRLMIAVKKKLKRKRKEKRKVMHHSGLYVIVMYRHNMLAAPVRFYVLSFSNCKQLYTFIYSPFLSPPPIAHTPKSHA